MVTIDDSNYKNTNSKILIMCDIKSSTKCRGIYYKEYRHVLNSRIKNDKKDICTFCYNKTISVGNKNGAFKHIKINNFFNTIDSELKAYLLGLIAGDGSLDKTAKRLVLYAHYIDIESVLLLRNTICSTAHLHNDNNTYSVKINSTEIVKDLCRHLKIIPGKKSYTISIPDIEPKLIRHFLRGLLDSDGSIMDPLAKCTTPRCKITSYSELLKQEIKQFCDSYKINSYMNKTDIMFSGIHAIKFMNILYDDSNYSLTRKRCLYKMWSTWRSGYGTAFRTRKNVAR